MAPFTSVVEIARSPEDVFAYVDDLARHGEWQDTIVSVHVDTDGPTRIGTRATEVRKIGKREQTITYEITVHDPPTSFGFRGVDGPIRPEGKGRIEPLDDGKRSRLTLEFDLTGHGIGKLLLPLARSQAKKEVPASQQRLKERLEAAAAS